MLKIKKDFYSDGINIQFISSDAFKEEILNNAGLRVMGYLNARGGDFKIVKLDYDHVTLRNTSICPCMNIKNKTQRNFKCIELELILMNIVKDFDDDLTAGFIDCTCEGTSYCQLCITYYPY